jgi:hypothetical protein
MSAARTSAERLKALADCGDPERLKAALRELCAEFGFLRLESEAQELELMSRLGVSRFGNEVLVVDLPH